jgi:hypothetical protein
MFRKIRLFKPNHGTSPQASRTFRTKIASFGERFAKSTFLTQKLAPAKWSRKNRFFLAIVSRNQSFRPKKWHLAPSIPKCSCKSRLCSRTFRKIHLFKLKDGTWPQAFFLRLFRKICLF